MAKKIIKLTKCESTAIKGFGFDDELGLVIQYNTGKSYSYEKSTKTDLANLIAMESKGKYLAHLRNSFKANALDLELWEVKY